MLHVPYHAPAAVHIFVLPPSAGYISVVVLFFSHISLDFCHLIFHSLFGLTLISLPWALVLYSNYFIEYLLFFFFLIQLPSDLWQHFLLVFISKWDELSLVLWDSYEGWPRTVFYYSASKSFSCLLVEILLTSLLMNYFSLYFNWDKCY